MPDRTRNWDKTPQAQEYRDKYTSEHYDRVLLTVPKGFRDTIDTAAQRAGVSKSQLIVQLVTEYMKTTGTE